MHDPMPRKRHLNEPFHIFFAPVIDQPDRVLVRADDTQRPQFFLPLIRNLELKIAEIQIAYYFFRSSVLFFTSAAYEYSSSISSFFVKSDICSLTSSFPVVIIGELIRL